MDVTIAILEHVSLRYCLFTNCLTNEENKTHLILLALEEEWDLFFTCEECGVCF